MLCPNGSYCPCTAVPLAHTLVQVCLGWDRVLFLGFFIHTPPTGQIPQSLCSNQTHAGQINTILCKLLFSLTSLWILTAAGCQTLEKYLCPTEALWDTLSPAAALASAQSRLSARILLGAHMAQSSRFRRSEINHGASLWRRSEPALKKLSVCWDGWISVGPSVPQRCSCQKRNLQTQQ